MKVGIASDHKGYKMKEKIKKYLTKKGIEYIDYGTNSLENVDYVDYAMALCKGILDKDIDNGILICGTGIGMSIVANKVKGIMCAKVDDAEEAKLAKEHNHANVISFSANQFEFAARDIVDAYLNSNFLDLERYNRRIDKIKEIEKKRSYK